jgi:LPXTG-site transpeptidase (sortase) family protein
MHPAPFNWHSRQAFRLLGAASAIFVVACLLFTGPVYYAQLRYDLGGHSATTSPTASSPAEAGPGTPELSISKIGVKAPIVFVLSQDETDVLAGLQNGVIHYPSTAVPGQAGNVVIFGHSSADWWKPGSYKFIFSLLNKLTVNDQITITYGGRHYSYVVTGSRVVQPTEVSVMNPTDTPTLTLITCSPLGTSLRRLVVTARQIGPAPVSDTKVATASSATNLQSIVGSPGVSANFWDFLARIWRHEVRF